MDPTSPLPCGPPSLGQGRPRDLWVPVQKENVGLAPCEEFLSSGALLRMGPQSQPNLGAPSIDWLPCRKRWIASCKNGLLLLFYPLVHPPSALSLPHPPADFKLWSASHNGIFQILLEFFFHSGNAISSVPQLSHL